EPVRPTGLQRTFPNWMASEAGRGMEFNAWSSGNPPDHETILPFTRLMGGPMDYTPGIFQTDLSYYDKNKKETIHTTLAKQLALYVTMYSPLQMAADLPENYLRFPDAFQFIKDVAVNWSRSVYLDAEPGDYIYVARKEKSGNNWFVGCITDEVSRKANISLNFLDPGKTYKATIYADTKDADYEKNPMSYKITNVLVNNKSKLPIYLAPGGGSAITIQYASKADIKALKSIDNKSFIEKWEKK
ncbi:MAG: glycoside hydrolase family 97 catalytic domain-containing protein, partial [Saprospiraceae bacterium]